MSDFHALTAYTISVGRPTQADPGAEMRLCCLQPAWWDLRLRMALHGISSEKFNYATGVNPVADKAAGDFWRSPLRFKHMKPIDAFVAP